MFASQILTVCRSIQTFKVFSTSIKSYSHNFLPLHSFSKLNCIPSFGSRSLFDTNFKKEFKEEIKYFFIVENTSAYLLNKVTIEIIG